MGSAIPAEVRVSMRRALDRLSSLPSLRSSLLPSQSLLRPSIFPPLLQSSRFATAAINVPRSKRFELSVKEGTLPIAALKKFNPVTPGTRHRIVIDKSQLWPGRSEPKLTKRIKSHAGRNHTGQITIRGRCAPKHRRKYRIIDFKRSRTDPAIVQRFEYDPNRSTFIALIKYESDGELSYILAPRDLAVGATVASGDEASFAPGNAMALGSIPDGTEVHNIEMLPGKGGEIVRSAGAAARIISKDDKYAILKLPSSEIRKMPIGCMATIGVLSNDQWRNRRLGKAGASWWVGRRPQVRGVAMNPVDHPMGGGEGTSSGGRVSCSPWGWYTKGLRTRNRKQFSSKLILRRRNHEKLGLASINTGGW